VPYFITFEGLDGSGKSTHLQRVAEWCRRRAQPVLVTHEPGGTPLGEEIRRVFLDVEWREVDGIVEALLVFASRRQHLHEVIDPALARGEHVLCDRFTDSTFAYQGFGRGVPLTALEAADRLATGGRVPDRSLMLDLPAAEAQRRGQSPKRRGQEGGVDRLDSEALEFYEKVRKGYLELARRDPDRFRVIDASGDAAATEEGVKSALADLLGGDS
jgi:dTMP kinase